MLRHTGAQVGGVWAYQDAVEDEDLLGVLRDRPRVMGMPLGCIPYMSPLVVHAC